MHIALLDCSNSAQKNHINNKPSSTSRNYLFTYSWGILGILCGGGGDCTFLKDNLYLYR
uniref:Uncharacterized protein n=1 Tax=Anguilla anguilla TaxID=7936 RepID=A0A0E9WVI5_ANGAN